MAERSGAPLAISVGDAGGIGPLVTAAACAKVDDHYLVFGDAEQMRAELERANVDSGRVQLIDVGPGEEVFAPSPKNGAQQLAALDAAIAAVQRGEARALVTGPTSKRAITDAGTPFTGQTERLAAACGLAPDAVTMMFFGPVLRVALVTTHLAIAQVPRAITAARVERATRHLIDALARVEQRGDVWVAGLNPHAGEGGLFGDEEPKVIGPVVDALRGEARLSGMTLKGPGPAESIFRAASRRELAGVVAMFHDQATIASKLLDWGAAVNMTYGLPFIRTSVDHGVAYDARARGSADADGMIAAIELAQRMTR